MANFSLKPWTNPFGKNLDIFMGHKDFFYDSNEFVF